MTRSPSANWIGWSILLVAFALMALMLYASVAGLIRFIRLDGLHNNLKWVVLGLHRYHDENGCFPPAVVHDDKGVAIHSWRAIIEPILAESDPKRGPISNYDFTQPWNSPHNLSVRPRHNFDRAPYRFLAIVGDGAAWSPDGVCKLSDFKDGTSDTMLLIAIRDTDISWYEPVDATTDGRSLYLRGKKRENTVEAFVVFADGSVRFYGAGIPPDVLKAFITIDAGDDPKET